MTSASACRGRFDNHCGSLPRESRSVRPLSVHSFGVMLGSKVINQNCHAVCRLKQYVQGAIFQLADGSAGLRRAFAYPMHPFQRAFLTLPPAANSTLNRHAPVPSQFFSLDCLHRLSDITFGEDVNRDSSSPHAMDRLYAYCLHHDECLPLEADGPRRQPSAWLS